MRKMIYEAVALLFLALVLGGALSTAFGATYNFYFNGTEQGDNSSATPTVIVDSANGKKQKSVVTGKSGGTPESTKEEGALVPGAPSTSPTTGPVSKADEDEGDAEEEQAAAPMKAEQYSAKDDALNEMPAQEADRSAKIEKPVGQINAANDIKDPWYLSGTGAQPQRAVPLFSSRLDHALGLDRFRALFRRTNRL